MHRCSRPAASHFPLTFSNFPTASLPCVNTYPPQTVALTQTYALIRGHTLTLCAPSDHFQPASIQLTDSCKSPTCLLFQLKPVSSKSATSKRSSERVSSVSVGAEARWDDSWTSKYGSMCECVTSYGLEVKRLNM